jgi:NitT/TauT family transport system permease protein
MTLTSSPWSTWTLRAASAVLALALWHGIATLAPHLRLPPPVAVADALISAARSGALWTHCSATLARVVASFLIAMTIGSVIGIALGRSPLLDRLFGGWLLVFLNMPALVVMILAYIWFGLSESAAIFAVAVNKIPHVAVTLREGAKALDPALDEMARLYRLNRRDSLRHVILPQLTPYFLAAARSGLALIWKIVLVVELLGRPNGVGFVLHMEFQLFNVAAILAYAIAFILIIQMIELCLLKPLEARCGRWRS